MKMNGKRTRTLESYKIIFPCMLVSNSERVFFAIHTLTVIKLTHSYQFNTCVHFFHNAYIHRETSTTSATEGEINVVT